MRSPNWRSGIEVTAAILFVGLTVLLFDGQVAAQRPQDPKSSASAWTPPRTPWGDPDLQGTYTNTYEKGTPLERPDEFAGRKLEDVKGEELARSSARRRSGRSPRSRVRCTRRITGGRTISISSAAVRRGWSSTRRTARFRR